MSAVSLREDALDALQEAEAPILQAPPRPMRIERLQGLNFLDFYRWREAPRLPASQRLWIRRHERKQERLSKLAERLNLAGVHIRERIEGLEHRVEQLKRQRIEREQRRVGRAKTPLGRLAERLEAAGWTPPSIRHASSRRAGGRTVEIAPVLVGRA